MGGRGAFSRTKAGGPNQNLGKIVVGACFGDLDGPLIRAPKTFKKGPVTYSGESYMKLLPRTRERLVLFFNGLSETLSIKNYITNVIRVCNKWQLLNFISGEVKMVIYISRGNKIEGKRVCEAASMWRCNASCRLRLVYDIDLCTTSANAVARGFKRIYFVLSIDQLHFAHFLQE